MINEEPISILKERHGELCYQRSKLNDRIRIIEKAIEELKR